MADTMTHSVQLRALEFNPILTMDDTIAVEPSDTGKGESYLVIEPRFISNPITVLFMLPAQFSGPARTGSMLIHLRHRSRGGAARVRVSVNGSVVDTVVTDGTAFGVQTVAVSLQTLKDDGVNRLEIAPTPTVDAYLLATIGFAVNVSDRITSLANLGADDFRPGLLYTNAFPETTTSDGELGLILDGSRRMIRVNFYVPPRFDAIADVSVTVTLRHSMPKGSGFRAVAAVNDDDEYKVFTQLPANLTEQAFTIRSSDVLHGGQLNKIDIGLDSPAGYAIRTYRLTSVTLDFTAALPPVTQSAFNTYVAHWILMQRTNIAELNQIPRDDLSAWQWIANAPAWFYLPWLPSSPTEGVLLIRKFGAGLLTSLPRLRSINAAARDFHRELLTTDIPRKNALRHTYWMIEMTRAFGRGFALRLGEAHEYAHVDLTIEGPFDAVTDLINNLIGVRLAMADPSTPAATLADSAWAAGNLAWCRNFRVENGRQMADVSWQKPLNYLATTYNIRPVFDALQKDLISRFNVTLPNMPEMHDDL